MLKMIGTQSWEETHPSVPDIKTKQQIVDGQIVDQSLEEEETWGAKRDEDSRNTRN